MKAAVYYRYGPPSVVEIAEVPPPSPGPRDVLVAVTAATVTAADWRLRSGTVPKGFGLLARLALGWRRPRRPILGTDAAGRVEAVGADVRRFHPGERVVVHTATALGAHAEYLVVPEDGVIVPVPERVADRDAAAIPFGGTTALYYLRDKAHVRAGDRVLVNGASGAVGSAAVQIATLSGATVTGVCSARNGALVRSLGAHRVLDYDTVDFTRTGDTYDVIVDCVGNCSFARCAPALAQGGRLLLLVASLGQLVSAALRPSRAGRRVLAGEAPARLDDVRWLVQQTADGRYRPLVERTFPFARIADAHALVESRRARGSVVVTVP